MFINFRIPCVVILLALLAGSSTAEPTLQDAESRESPMDSRRILRSTERPITPQKAVIVLNKLFNVPISFEWAYVDENRLELKQPEGQFELRQGDTLAAGLNSATAIATMKLSWSRMLGNICILPTGTNGEFESTLDTVVSLQLENATAWDGFLSVARLVNEQPTTDRPLRISPHFIHNMMTPPPEFHMDNSISLSLENVTARNAICAIIEAAPFQGSYWYSNHSSAGGNLGSTVTIWIFLNGEQYHTEGGMNMAEYLRWSDQIEATVPERLQFKP